MGLWTLSVVGRGMKLCLPLRAELVFLIVVVELGFVESIMAVKLVRGGWDDLSHQVAVSCLLALCMERRMVKSSMSMCLFCCRCCCYCWSEGMVRAMRRTLMPSQSLRLPWSAGQAFQVMLVTVVREEGRRVSAS